MFRYWRTNAPNAISEEEKVGLKAGKMYFFSLKLSLSPTPKYFLHKQLHIHEAVYKLFKSCFKYKNTN